MTASFGATSMLLTESTWTESETRCPCKTFCRLFIESKGVYKNVHIVCAENTADASRPVYGEKLLRKPRVVDETFRKCWSWTSCEIPQNTIPQDSHAQIVDAPRLCECKQERRGEMRSIIPTHSDALKSECLSRT